MLRFKAKISSSQSRKMILMLAKHGNYFPEVIFKSYGDVERYYAKRRIDFDREVENCRNYFQHAVPLFENLIGSTLHSSNSSLARINNETGEIDCDTVGPGTLVINGCHAKFEAAVRARDRAVQNNDFTEFQNAVVQGIASIESYIVYRVELWNLKNSNDQLSDSSEKKTGFDNKISCWIPKMASGKKLDQSGSVWNDFNKLRVIRNDIDIHPKSSGYSISYQDLASKINLFRNGIAQLLIELHILFNDPIPSIIIRAAFAPDVEFVSEDL